MMVQRELAYTDCIHLSLNGCALSIHHVRSTVPVQLETQEMAMPRIYLVTRVTQELMFGGTWLFPALMMSMD